MEKKSTLRISRQRKALIADYATAAINLYGVIRIPDLVMIFNAFEEVQTTEKEAALALQRYLKIEDVEYSILNNVVSGPEFQPHFEDYETVVNYIFSQQLNKPRYVPDKETFLRYADYDYFEPQKPYEDLKAYVLKHKLSPIGEGLDGIDGDLLDLREIIQEGASIQDYIDYFQGVGYVFKDMDKLNDFIQMLSDVHNNSRLYFNNGFTPHEIFEKMNAGNLKPLPKKPFILKKPVKTGRNDACPCGSGSKYKNCHGKNQLM